MSNELTTAASVASRLTDLRISTLTQFIETRGRFQIAESDEKMCEDIAAILRDYVRLRRLANVVKAKVNYAFYHGETYTTQDAITELHRLLADAEKGETK